MCGKSSPSLSWASIVPVNRIDTDDTHKILLNTRIKRTRLEGSTVRNYDHNSSVSSKEHNQVEKILYFYR